MPFGFVVTAQRCVVFHHKGFHRYARTVTIVIPKRYDMRIGARVTHCAPFALGVALRLPPAMSGALLHHEADGVSGRVREVRTDGNVTPRIARSRRVHPVTSVDCEFEITRGVV